MSRAKGIKRLFPTARRLLVDRALRALDLGAPARVLVVGSGADPYRDLFPAARSYVRLDLDAHSSTVDVRGDAHALPFRDASFDCLLAAELLEHLAEPALFAREAHRVLARGGVLVATVPFLFHHHADPHDYHRPTSAALARLFARFEAVEVIPHGHRLHVLSDLITTSFTPRPLLFPLRFLNHLLVPLAGGAGGASTAPSGHMVVARVSRSASSDSAGPPSMPSMPASGSGA